MKILSPRFWIAALSGGAVLYLVFGDFRRTSPGPISNVHDQAGDLSNSSCSQCHGGWFEAMTEACLACHEPIAEQIEAGAGLHGIQGADKAQRCALCHSEHHGPDFAIINGRSFAMAGVANAEEFDHEMVGYPMAGKHLELECSKCHEHAEDAVLPEGERRFLGLDRDCSTCHEDSHEGQMVIGCAKCHGQEDFKKLAAYGHEEHLSLAGGHADVACRECHAEGRPYSLEVYGSGRRPPSRECQDCHDSPHRNAFVDGVAEVVGTTPGSSCITCHEAEHLTFWDERLGLTTEHHAFSGFPLETPHDEVACVKCHGDVGAFALRHPGRSPDECRTCHDDPHGGQFDDSTLGAQGCTGCHEREWFEPHAFTVEQHSQTEFALTGTHLETDCHDCHQISAPGNPRLFHGTVPECHGCHGDAHGGFFDTVAAGREPVQHGKCAHCHLTTSFAEIPADGFDHGEWTGFEVSGAHAQAGCEACHPPDPEPDRFGRTFGRVRDHFGTYGGCVTCHDDPHRGEFDVAGRPREVDGHADCARCHVQASFRAFPEGFDHHLWTSFPLDGGHGEISCAECHAPLRPPDELGRSWQRAKGRACGSCHTDPHAGQFEKNGDTNCERCHRTAESFSALSFRHNLDSRFRLGDAHEKLACGECHKPFLIDEVEVVRYRPLGTECVDCHGDHDDPLRRRRGRK